MKLKKLKRLARVALGLLVSGSAIAAPESPSAPASTVGEAGSTQVKYKTGKDVSFDELLIQGQLQRPEVSVVTGELGQGNELLRLRENFLDRAAVDFGEDVQ